ncbi:MAG: YdcF family protein [Coleofasciculaceae cyanobacterium]
MKTFHRKRKGYRFYRLMICTLIVLLLSFIPVRLAIAYLQSPNPQAILTLGGGGDREPYTAHFAKNFPDLPIWVSSGQSPDLARQIFRSVGVPDTQVHFDRRAVDTVTNFTSLVADLKSQNIDHIYLITSDFHIRRAKAIAFLVLGSRGIAFTPVAIPTQQPHETWTRVLRDFGRAFLWLFTGRTGASLNPNR